MKKASVATTYKFNTRKAVEFAPTYRLSIATTEKILRSSMKSAGIAGIDQIIKHPILGIGWGNISAILGTDERGMGLNASNIFLEVWLGSGLIGILSFKILLGYIFVKSSIMYLDREIEDKTVTAFIILGWAAIVFPNLFNSGIFLGFLWIYLAIAISLIEAKK